MLQLLYLTHVMKGDMLVKNCRSAGSHCLRLSPLKYCTLCDVPSEATRTLVSGQCSHGGKQAVVRLAGKGLTL